MSGAKPKNRVSGQRSRSMSRSTSRSTSRSRDDFGNTQVTIVIIFMNISTVWSCNNPSTLNVCDQCKIIAGDAKTTSWILCIMYFYVEYTLYALNMY